MSEQNVYTALMEIKQSLGRIEGAVEALAGPEGRVTKLERAQSNENMKQWIKATIVAPVVVCIQMVLRHYGLVK